MSATPLLERLGWRKASGVGEAGWSRTLLAGIVSLIYFLPVLVIIITAFKVQTEALSVPAKLFPTSFFGLIPEQYVFAPTIENFTSAFSRAYTSGAVAQNTGFSLFFFNSVFIAGTSVILALVIGTLAAFGFSR